MKYWEVLNASLNLKIPLTLKRLIKQLRGTSLSRGHVLQILYDSDVISHKRQKTRDITKGYVIT